MHHGRARCLASLPAPVPSPSTTHPTSIHTHTRGVPSREQLEERRREVHDLQAAAQHRAAVERDRAAATARAEADAAAAVAELRQQLGAAEADLQVLCAK